jgi:deoxycytidine triphosphate deaminase
MPGALLTNVQIFECLERREIEIRPFEEERCQVAHYPIDPETIWARAAYDWAPKHSFRRRQEPFLFAPNEYVLVEIRQHISLGEGFVGTFVPASNLIEKGLSLTAGKISFPFGANNERVRFGLRNNLPEPVEYGPGDLLAYLQIFDVRESARIRYKLSDRDKAIYEKRRARANDDGVLYDEPDSPV